jgi:hypothetical protein
LKCGFKFDMFKFDRFKFDIARTFDFITNGSLALLALVRTLGELRRGALIAWSSEQPRCGQGSSSGLGSGYPGTPLAWTLPSWPPVCGQPCGRACIRAAVRWTAGRCCCRPEYTCRV